MYEKSTRPSAKREVQKERSAKRDDRIARPRRAQTCEHLPPFVLFSDDKILKLDLVFGSQGWRNLLNRIKIVFILL